jgi:hypothetical protein
VSCSLTYDDALSRVRIEADSLCVTGVIDTYSRVVATGWGSTDTGQAWTTSGGSTSDYSVGTGVGNQNNVTENVFRTATLDAGVTDVDYVVTVRSNKLAAGANQLVEITGRHTDAVNHYSTRLTFTTAAAVNIDLRRRVAGVTTVIATAVSTGLTHVAGTGFHLRLQVIGSSIKAKTWIFNTPEPTTWHVEATDNAVTPTGTGIAIWSVLSSGTSNEPVNFSFDNLATYGAQYATVDRTTNGVTYTTVRGATEVGITTGCELERIVDDYEFPVGQEITYRVRSFGTGDNVLTSTTCTITVDLDDVWIKSIGLPFLNQRVNCVLNPSPIVRRARNGIFDIVGRSYPVGVTDLRGSREVTVQVVTETTAEREDLDLLLASGSPVFYHTPVGHPLPTMYAIIEDTAAARPVRNRLCNKDWRLFTLPSVEVAAPSADVVGSLGTWQTVVTTYATWADVLAAHATWASLLELVGTGEEVIVP